MRPSDLAREHGISTQAVRNYEQDGYLPPAARTASGHRVYTEVHAAALRAFLALVPAHGHATAGQVMTALHRGDPDAALAALDRGHARALHDRDTLDTVRRAVEQLAGDAPAAGRVPADGPPTRSIGELAHRLGLTPATLRAWEAAGVLAPERDPATGHRRYRAGDVRDADFARLLRRGGRPLEQIATVVRQLRSAGGTDALTAALEDWQRRLTAQGLARLHAAALLGRYLELRARHGGPAVG
ncbi:MerR family DNA-binding transcriptional regulator [Kitasatospora sp. NPDC054939]